ncbi:hypothetical protein BOX15_Mlig019115g1, partial [Macrostomum lignano]
HPFDEDISIFRKINNKFLFIAEIGDFLEEEYLDTLYLTRLKVLPSPVSEELLKKVMEYHKAHVGLTPEDAEYSLLDTVRKVDLYGIRLHPARDRDSLPLSLAVAHTGVLVFQGTVRINCFNWAKVRKLSFKRKKFLVKLHPETNSFYKDAVNFYFDSRVECKHFWKKCIEHHTFFRCQSARPLLRARNKVVSKGSSFRYCGRTQKQLLEFVRQNYYIRRPCPDWSSRSLPSRSPGGARRATTITSATAAAAMAAAATLSGRGSRAASTGSRGSHTLLPLHPLEPPTQKPLISPPTSMPPMPISCADKARFAADFAATMPSLQQRRQTGPPPVPPKPQQQQPLLSSSPPLPPPPLDFGLHR